jgi:nucleoside permease NupC
VVAGQVVRIKTDPPMKWGNEGRVFVWVYDHVFAPCNATMFALLAFFVASAAFRAFRARNVEAALLLGAAIIIMVGRMPMGRWLSESLPDIAQWILDVPNNGSRRAIIMGAAVGAIATSLRVVLGLERSHLGSD